VHPEPAKSTSLSPCSTDLCGQITQYTLAFLSRRGTASLHVASSRTHHTYTHTLSLSLSLSRARSHARTVPLPAPSGVLCYTHPACLSRAACSGQSAHPIWIQTLSDSFRRQLEIASASLVLSLPLGGSPRCLLARIVPEPRLLPW
jgi:hypothetical protein